VFHLTFYPFTVTCSVAWLGSLCHQNMFSVHWIIVTIVVIKLVFTLYIPCLGLALLYLVILAICFCICGI